MKDKTNKGGIVYATYSPPSLEERVKKLEREMIAVIEPRADADIIRIREFQQRLLVDDGPLSRVRRLVQTMRDAHFCEHEEGDADELVRKAYDAIVKICDGDR